MAPWVSVSNPQTETQGRSQFTTYLISTQNREVRRRYSDFQWLYGRLQTELPGALVPVIPHRRTLTTAQKLDPAFVEARKRFLQEFMDAVVAHPELARAPSMTPFMIDKFGIEFERGKKKVEDANPSIKFDLDEPISTSKGLSNMFAKAITFTKFKTGQQDLMHSPHEKEIQQIKAYVNGIESNIKRIVKASEGMVKLTGDMSFFVSELGPPVEEWKTAYRAICNQGDKHVDMMSAVVEFSYDFSTLLQLKRSEEHEQFETSMLRLNLDVKAIQRALHQRQHWQVEYTTRFQQIVSKDDAIAKATKNLKPSEITNKLAAEKQELQAQAKAEKAKMEETTERLLREFEANKSKLETTFRDALRRYAKLQMSFTDRINEAWGQLLPFVEEDKVQEGENPESSTPGTDVTEGTKAPPEEAPAESSSL